MIGRGEKIELRISALLLIGLTIASVAISFGGIRGVHATIPTDWVLEPSQTIECYHIYWTLNGGGTQLEAFCEAIRAEVQLNQVSNSQEDFYTVTLREYNYNSSDMYTSNIDAYITFNSPIPGGINTVQPQGQWYWCPQPTVTLSAANFVSVNLLIPCQQTDFSSTVGLTAGSTSSTHWHTYSILDLAVFDSYGEEGADIDVPKGQTWTFNFHYRDNQQLCTREKNWCGTSSNPIFPTEGCGDNCYFDISGSLTVTSNPSVRLSASPSSLYEMCYVNAYQCYTIPYGARPTSCYPSYCPPVPVCDTITLTNSGTSETYTMSASVPPGWGYSWQYQSVNLSGQATDCLSISAPYGLTTAGWYYITVNAVGSFGDVSTMTLPAYYWYYGAGGGGGCPCRID